MSNVNKLYFKMALTDEVKVKLNGTELNKNTFTKNSDGTFTLYTKDIKATQFNSVFTLELVKGNETISTVNYNVNAYVQSKYNAEGLENIVKALSNYGKSASAYLKALTDPDDSFKLEDDKL